MESPSIENPFQAVDHLFAKRILPEGPHTFLAYLLAMAREGHLCVSLKDGALYPSLGGEWDIKLIEESKNLPPLEGIVHEDDRWYLKRNWESEKTFIFHWERLRGSSPSLPVIPNLEGMRLEPEQREAILKAAKQAVTLICGGPGTGKTYTAACLIKSFPEQRVALAAPTGKATANLRRALGEFSCEVKTLHALLKGGFQLPVDLVLVDEGSMIDAELMARLFASVREGARLILLGDRDQLPPVESGNFFADLAHDLTHVTLLKTCLRAELKEIVEMAAKVKGGEAVSYEPLPHVRNLLDHISPDETLLTPMRKGLFGVEFLNQHIHEKRPAEEIPIMITTNDAAQDLFNGDVGVLKGKTAHFSDGRAFPEYRLPHYTYAYALSVHKSQGSEYDKVTLLLPEGSEVFGREMLYTAITRAKKQVRILAHEGVMEKVVQAHSFRHSGLRVVDVVFD